MSDSDRNDGSEGEGFEILGVQPSRDRKGDGINELQARILIWRASMTPPTDGDNIIRNPNHTSANYDPCWNK